VKKNAIIVIFAAAIVAGCANRSPIGLIDVNRIVANWDVYQRYQQQLMLEEQAISGGKGSPAEKNRAAGELQKKYAKITDELTAQIRNAANQVAAQRSLKLVVTKEGVGYGGVDITPEVEKIMNITEKASPSP
jgi:Skp family chaperone for outer membrane proteins